MRWVLVLALLSTSAIASRVDRLSVSPRLDRRDRLGASDAAPSPILLALSLLPPDSECSGTPPVGVTFSRASSATCIRSDGVANAVSSDMARATGAGLLVEGAATNGLLFSRNVSNAVWTKGGDATCSATSGCMNNGGGCAFCSGSTPSVAQAVASPTGSRVASVYVQPQDGTCPGNVGTFSLTADAEATGPVAVPGGAWARLSLRYTSDGDVTVGLAGNCTFRSDYWQDEAGAIATTPVVTIGTAATRAADVPIVPTSGLSEASGCVQISVRPTWTGAAVGSWALSNGSATSRFLYTSTTDHMRSAGGTWAMAVAAGFTAGVAVPWRVEWGSSGATLVNVSTSASNTDVDASAWGTFGPSLRIGQAAPFYASSLVLGATPEACR